MTSEPTITSGNFTQKESDYKLSFQRDKNLFITIPKNSRPGLLRVTGKDSFDFLHGQLTNEVKGLKPGESITQARVTRTGQLSFIFRMKSTGDGFYLLFSNNEDASLFKEEIDRFIFSEDIELKEELDFSKVIYVSSPDSTLVFDLDKSIESPTKQNTFFISNTLTGDPGGFLFLKDHDSENLIKLLLDSGFTEWDFELFQKESEYLRVEGGILKKSADFIPGKTLLPETAQEAELVSYSKGCYLGQEVIARTKTYGSTPFALRGLIFEGNRFEDILSDLPDVSENILEITDSTPEGKSIGKICSRVISKSLNKVIALAYLSREARTPGSEITIKGKTMPIFAKVVILPFIGSKSSEEKTLLMFDEAVKAYAEGNDDKAISTLEEVLRLNPSFNDAYETLGVMLGKSEKYHEAIEIFRRLEEIAPCEPLVNTNLSLYLMKIGNKDEAEKEATKATIKSFSKASDEFSAKELEKQQIELERNAAKRKKEMFEEVLEFDPEDPIALFGLGNALIKLENYFEAEKSLRKALHVDPKNSAVYLSLGKVLEKNRKIPEALNVYKKGIEQASIKGDLMPLKEMQTRSLLLKR